jgi:hypothetical protein
MNAGVHLSVAIAPSGTNAAEAERRVKAFCAAKGVVGEVVASPKEAVGRYVLVMDASLETPVKEVDKLIAALEAGADLAVGTRRRWLGSADCAFRCYKIDALREGRPKTTVRVRVMWKRNPA